jgi:hypothetical protein
LKFYKEHVDDLLKEAELLLKRKLKERNKITMMDIVAQKQMQDCTNLVVEAKRVSFKVSLICLPNNNELGFGG